MPRFGLVVFDLDGTLIDSIGDLAAAVNAMLAERGAGPLSRRAVAGMVGEGARLLVERAMAAANLEGDGADALSRFLEIYDGLLPGETRPYEGIPEALGVLGRRARLAVLTNKPTEASLKLLDALGLRPFFAEVVGGDGPFPRKPAPAGLLHLSAAAGVPPGETVLVGDSTIDLLTAHAAGTAACIARYGFGQVTFDETRLRGGELMAVRPHDLCTLL
ncbi:MAG TPA: HAD-IA family hydrolase [Vicinamibacterales bacterium]|mgnify:CR=1 FL=1|nr:HAD-IA family hydrolase [Acidobacteriota bacterium]HOC17176.1 HAD-IA family hydrolase [Vicinamibacterales bacterium]